MLESRIQQHFFESADLVYQLADGLAQPVANAAQSAVGCLTSGGKLLVCGLGAANPLAHLLCILLMGRFERDRPGLAALPLSTALACNLARGGDGTATEEGLALQLRALGQPGDLLVVFSLSAPEPAITAAVQEAHAKDMNVIWFTARSQAATAALLRETDVWVAAQHERPARVREVHLLALHALCDAIDLQLLGEAEPS